MALLIYSEVNAHSFKNEYKDKDANYDEEEQEDPLVGQSMRSIPQGNVDLKPLKLRRELTRRRGGRGRLSGSIGKEAQRIFEGTRRKK